ncbi:unnamed protein product [Ciceribacter sp. T2.26MG-112.2]|uniref:hypothetical protein n=1 Tax=Ciceribacter sp. T2.26MG-112.2 TaxID=3137154 RepID=UPI000E15DBDB|nr:hypothetical protein [Ciceribacter naphthalenivorans]SSC71435.1 unnamed protein product [Ciceribacter naphthalenivorans]
MTTYHPLPRLPLVDLSSNYLAYLDGIDAENQERHLQGEPLLDNPSYDEFVELCRENGFRHKAQVSAHVMDFDSFDRVLDEEFSDEPELKWLLPLPSVGAFADEDITAFIDSDEVEEWISELGTFAFPSSARH